VPPATTAVPEVDAEIVTMPSISAAQLQSMLTATLGASTVYVDPTPKRMTSSNVTFTATFSNVTEADRAIVLIDQGALGPLVLAAAVQDLPLPPASSTPSPSGSGILDKLWNDPVLAGAAAGGAVVVATVVGIVLYNVFVSGGSAAAAAGTSVGAAAAAELDFVPMTAINHV
jgi:hypothetical protein